MEKIFEIIPSKDELNKLTLLNKYTKKCIKDSYCRIIAVETYSIFGMLHFLVEFLVGKNHTLTGVIDQDGNYLTEFYDSITKTFVKISKNYTFSDYRTDYRLNINKLMKR